MTTTRKTKQKEAILRLVKGTNSHPTADWVYEQVRREIPSISLGTVYRNLKLLQQEGKILGLEFAATITRYDARTQNHYHFICQQCGHLFDLDEPVDTEHDERVAQKMGCRVFYHRSEFYGLCQDCQTRNAVMEDTTKNSKEIIRSR